MGASIRSEKVSGSMVSGRVCIKSEPDERGIDNSSLSF